MIIKILFDYSQTLTDVAGNIRDILGTAMTHRNEYRKRLVAISNYMQKFKVKLLSEYMMLIRFTV